MYVPLVTYSVHIPPLGNLFCTYGRFWRLFCTYTFPCLSYSLQVARLHSYSYTSDFCGLFYFLLKTYHIMTAHVPLVMYSVHIPRLGDLFCTYGIFWWLFVYIPAPPTWKYHHFMSSFIYYCLLWSFLYIYFFLMSFLYGWYLHLDIPLVTYSVHVPSLGDLFST